MNEFFTVVAIWIAFYAIVIYIAVEMQGVEKMVRRYSDFNRFKHLKQLADDSNMYIVEVPGNKVLTFVLYRKNPNPYAKGIKLGSAVDMDKLEELVKKFANGDKKERFK